MGGMRSYFAKETESGWQGNVQYCSLLHSQRSAERGKWPICDQFPLNFLSRILSTWMSFVFICDPNLINPSTRLPQIDRINSDRATDSIVKQHIPFKDNWNCAAERWTVLISQTSSGSFGVVSLWRWCEPNKLDRTLIAISSPKIYSI